MMPQVLQGRALFAGRALRANEACAGRRVRSPIVLSIALATEQLLTTYHICRLTRSRPEQPRQTGLYGFQVPPWS